MVRDVKILWSINRRTTVGDTASRAAATPTVSHSGWKVDQSRLAVAVSMVLPP
jgi:hypothetical protein